MSSATSVAHKAPASSYGRLNLKVSEETARALQRLTRADGATATEIIRRAVALLDLVDQETATGKQLALVDKEGSLERLRLLY